MVLYAPYVTSYVREPSRPSGGPQPGAIALDAWINGESPWAASFTSLGIYVPRDICGNYWPRWRCVGSQHARGAALDAGCRAITGGIPAGHALAAWLVQHHAILGVQEVIWARRRWDNQTRRWATYSGPSPHLDHVHIALNTSGARYLTLGRIRSVAPQPPEDDPLSALTDTQQRDLYNKVNAIYVTTTATLKAAKMEVIRRKGSSGMSTVSVRFGSFRIPLATQAEADAWKAMLGQSVAVNVVPAVFDTLKVD